MKQILAFDVVLQVIAPESNLPALPARYEYLFCQLSNTNPCVKIKPLTQGKTIKNQNAH
jgi:hypothetical protein